MAGSLETRLNQLSHWEKKCRNAIQQKSVLDQLQLAPSLYERTCALLDFIDDTQEALFSVTTNPKRKTLNRYFLAYGFLQILYSRQYALRDIMNVLRLEIPTSLGKSTLVTARDNIIGHPIGQSGPAHVIYRGSLNERGFEYWSYDAGSTKRENLVNYESLLDAHVTAMQDGLSTVFSYLAGIENKWREKMRNEPLSPTLHGMNYIVQQIGAALVEKEKYGALIAENCKNLISALSLFRKRLAKRIGEEISSYEVDHIIEGIKFLQTFHPPADKQAEGRYRIISDGIECNMKRLEQTAHDIDEKEKTDLT